MLILACVLLAVAVVPLTGASLRRLRRLQWRAPWLIVLALVTQVVVLEIPGLPEQAAAAVHLVTYGFAAAFVWVNRRVRGLLLLAVGAASNGVAIALNGGTLPSTAAAREVAGLQAGDGFANSAIVEDPVLGILGDNFAIPAWAPLANVFSIGDVLIVAGAIWVVYSVTYEPDVAPRHARAAGSVVPRQVRVPLPVAPTPLWPADRHQVPGPPRRPPRALVGQVR